MPSNTIDLAVLSADTRDLLGLLAQHKVAYLLCGGAAVIYYGRVRTTGDVDIFYDRQPANAAITRKPPADTKMPTTLSSCGM